MMGFKKFHAAQAILDVIETVHMIRKGQILNSGTTLYQQFSLLAA